MDLDEVVLVAAAVVVVTVVAVVAGGATTVPLLRLTAPKAEDTEAAVAVLLVGVLTTVVCPLGKATPVVAVEAPFDLLVLEAPENF